MEINDHPIFDKRQKKPPVYSLKDLNEDFTLAVIETYKIGKAEIRFYTPNIISIFLSASNKELQKAEKIYDTLIRPKLIIRERFELSELETVELYNFLESIQTAIVVLYSATEALANILIPDGYLFEQKNYKGEVESLDKIAIEKRIATSEKLKEIIPMALKIKSPSKSKWWSGFKKFEVLRNDIVHVKSTSLTNINSEKKIMKLLVDDSVFGKINATNNLIKELSVIVPCNSDFPILKNTEPLIPIEIDSWENSGFKRSD